MFPCNPGADDGAHSSPGTEDPRRLEEEAHRGEARVGDWFVELAKKDSTGETKSAGHLVADGHFGGAVAIGGRIRIAPVDRHVERYREAQFLRRRYAARRKQHGDDPNSRERSAVPANYHDRRIGILQKRS